MSVQKRGGDAPLMEIQVYFKDQLTRLADKSTAFSVFLIGFVVFTIVVVISFFIDFFFGAIVGLTGVSSIYALSRPVSMVFLGPVLEEFLRFKALRILIQRHQSPLNDLLLALIFSIGWSSCELLFKALYGTLRYQFADFLGIPLIGIFQVPVLHFFCSLLILIMLKWRQSFFRSCLVCSSIHCIFNASGVLQAAGVLGSLVPDTISILMMGLIGLTWRFQNLIFSKAAPMQQPPP